MLKRIALAILVSLAWISVGFSPAQAVNNPNVASGIVVSSSSPDGAAVNEGRLSIVWQKPTVIDATHPVPIAYEVTVSEGSRVVSTIPLYLTNLNQNDFSAEATGLTGGTTYSVTITSIASGEGRATSSTFSGTPKTVSAAPTVGSAVAAPGSVALTWSAPSNNGGDNITKYVIKTDRGDTYTAEANETSKTISGLTAGQEVVFSIQAKNGKGSSTWAPFSSVTLPSKPGKPTSITATANTSSISVSWLAPTITGNSPITGYKVYLYDNLSAPVGNPTVVTQTSTELTGISAGTYTVKVSATNAVSDGDLSDASSNVIIASSNGLIDNTPVFTPSTLPNLVIGGTQSVSVTVPSEGVVTITATGTPSGACTYSAGILTAVAEGTCSVRATSPATSTYAEAIGTKTFTITKTLQTITFAPISNQPLPGPLTVTATSSSGLTVSFSASGNCTVSGRTVSFTSQGACSVTASQSGNGSYAAATPVTRTFSITAAAGGSSDTTPTAPSAGGGFSGGGGGVGTTWFNLFIADPDDFTRAYSGDACAYFIHLVKEGDKTYGPVCASKAGALDYEANDGDYIIRTFDKAYPTFYKEYKAKVTFGTFEVTGAGYRGGSVPRRSITVLKKSEHPSVIATPTPTPTPSSTATPKPTASPSPSASGSASPAPSASAKPTGYVIGGKVTGAIKASTLTAATTKVTLKLSANFQAVVPTAKKGDKITMTIKDPKGKTFTAPVVKVAKAGSVKLPSVKFSVAGKYTITIKVGTKTKVVTLTATK